MSREPNASGPEQPPPEPEQQQPELPDRRLAGPALRFWLLMLLLLGAYLVFFQDGVFGGQGIPYSEFKQRLRKGEVSKCQVAEDRITGTITPKGKTEDAEAEPFSFHTVRIEDPDLIKELMEAGVEYKGVPSSGIGTWILVWVGLLLLFFLFVLPFLASRIRAPGSVLAFGRSKAKLVASMDTGVTFDDVAGCEEAKQELREVVDFLANPQRYVKLGAKIPKGLILIGGPGTGKTLLARAIAGEAQVPFFSISGSEFVEMFVGVGAARVRDLFDQALKKAPCIVFIDEIDAVGRARGLHMSAVSDEREQTLNQLLVEMDGFEANNGVILLAATNRPDVLDRALMRPGRFDRQVVLDIPDLSAREAILKVHARNKPLAGDADLHDVARATPGLAGADLANILNESALLAARRRSDVIEQVDLEMATERVVAGPERRSRRLRDEDKRRVACHESGHALVAHYSEYADPVHKISIVPRGRAALGFTLQLPEEEQLLLTRDQLRDKVAGLLGGRAAEELVLGDVSTGASDDLERATTLVRQMICTYGMGKSVGLMHCAHEMDGRYLPMEWGTLQRDCSEDTAREIDAEVKQTLDQVYEGVLKLLGEHRSQLERVTEVLTERETLTAEGFRELLANAS